MAQTRWDRLVADYGIEDSGGELLLETALTALDRMQAAQAAIAKDGATVEDRWHQVKPHPLLTVERYARSGIYLTWNNWNAARAQQEHDGTSAWELFGGWPQYPAVWATIADRAVSEWSAQYPGTRPASWWFWSAPELRRLTRGTYTGVKGMHRCHETGIAYIGDWEDDPPLVESQPTFLDRLNLWIPGERDRVPSAAFAKQLFSHALTTAPGSARGCDGEDDTGGTQQELAALVFDN